MILRNPILRGFNPDPSWCVADGEIYLTTSSFNWVPGLPIYQWKGTKWQLIAHAVPEASGCRLDQAEDSGGIYAPTLRFIDGTFVLVCTSVLPEGAWQASSNLNGDAPCEGSFIMTAANPEGPWSGPRWIRGAGGIDPDVFEDQGGQVWWAGTRLAKNPMWPQQTEIWVRTFDLTTAHFTGPEHVVWHGAVEGVVWSEGPHLYWRDGWYYLLTAEGGTAEDHSVSVARAQSVKGPWEGCKRNPIFTHRNLGFSYPIHNVGHADLLHYKADGVDQWWAVMLGVRSKGGHHMLGREPFICPVSWENAWPVFAPTRGKLPNVIDFPAGKTLQPNASQAYASHDEPPEWEAASSEFITPCGPAWKNEEFCGARVSEWKFAAEWESDEEASALAIVHDARNWAKLVRISHGWRAEVCRNGELETLRDNWNGRSARLTLDGLTLVFGVNDEAGLGAADGSEISADARWLSTESAGGFTGCVMGVWGKNARQKTANLRLYAMREQ